ncbi:trypsin-like peptidase domain-containing protein [Streptomyces sp. NPDC058423]|uniref:trypsin-like peptidase domain-containing protein n=1 Tax=unclassified Streptomyces TaxID=2593676 RepID=UPI00364FE13D
MSHGHNPRTPRVILQDVRNFTVQIRDPGGDRVLGTGVVISRTGLIATCAHVIRAGGVEPRAGREAQVRVYFPSSSRDATPAELRTAWVAASFSDSDDDLVCLQVDGALPLPAHRVAVLGAASDSQDHAFRSYGYRQLEGYLGAWARGLILGEVDPPDGRRLLLDPIQLESSHIDAGMSGAPVLDVDRNLVIGVVTETWIAELAAKDRDTAWAVNASLLDHSPLRVDLRSGSLPLVTAEPARIQPALADRAAPRPGSRRMDGAPLLLPEWVGREALMEELHRFAADEEILVVGLVGFGGEGKSSLARQWIDQLDGTVGPEAVRIFWWSFTERASADDFLAAALEFTSGGMISPAEFPDGRARAECVAGLLALGRFLFVLDGLEVMQHQEGDHYGALASSDLHDFLTFFATPGHRSFCLITTRAPVFDIVPYVTYQQIDVEPLQPVPGRELLRKLGVHGPDTSLDQLVRDWGGHALTLSLMAAYLAKRYGGDARRVASLPAPEQGQPRDAMVRRILHDYDACLTEEERSFLTRYSVFRAPVPDEALRIVLPDTPWGDIAAESRQELSAMFDHLTAARIIRRDDGDRTSMHPLVRSFFAGRAEQCEQRRALHRRAMEYYLTLTPGDPRPQTLHELEPLVEAVHHACQSGAYDEACDLVSARLYGGEDGLITRQLGAYETALSVFADFYPQNNLMRQPLIRDSEARGWIQHEVATCLQMLGRLRDAGHAARRALQAFKAVGAWHDAAVSCQNLAELYLSLGVLPSCGPVIEEAFALARRAQDQEDLLVAETVSGALAHLQGRSADAQRAFAEALRIAGDCTPIPALYSSSGIRYAEHLRLNGRIHEARQVHQTNLEICRAARWRGEEAGCLVGLGDLAIDVGDPDLARGHYDEALRIARGITRRDVFVSALLGHVRWALHVGEPLSSLQGNLSHALTMATVGGFRIAEIEARLLLARAQHSGGDHEAAWAELAQADQMSAETGYHWGQSAAQALVEEWEAGP